jgi:hypothetical protein
MELVSRIRMEKETMVMVKCGDPKMEQAIMVSVHKTGQDTVAEMVQETVMIPVLKEAEENN